MPEHKHAPISLEDLTGKLQGRIDKFTPEHIRQIQIGGPVKTLGTDQGPASLNPANYSRLDKLRATMRLGRAREKIGEALPQRAQCVRDAIEDALTAVQTYQGVINLKAKGYLPEADPREFNETVIEAVSRVYRGPIIFPESQPTQKSQPEAQTIAIITEPVKPTQPVSEFRLQVLQCLDKFRQGSRPQLLLNAVSLARDGITKDQLLKVIFSDDPSKANQLFAAITHANDKLREDGIQIAPVRGDHGNLRYMIVPADQVTSTAKRKKKGEISQDSQ